MNLTQDIRFSLTPVPSLPEVESLWRTLEPHGEGTFFTSWTWIGTWLGCLPKSVQPMLLVGSCGGNAIGAAILVPCRETRYAVLTVRQYHFNATGNPEFDCIEIEHNGFVGTAEANRILWPAFVRWISLEMEGVDELVVPGIVDEVIGPVPKDSRLLHTVRTKPAFASVVPTGGIDAILSQLSRNSRQQLRQCMRAFGSLGDLQCEAAPSVDIALEWFSRLKAFHVESWNRRRKPHAFRFGSFESFHRALITVGVPQDSVVVLRLSAKGIPFGYLYSFVTPTRCLTYQSGFDDSVIDLKPGYIAHALAMASCADKGVFIYDFLAGENRLKHTFGKTHYVMQWHRFTRPSPALRAEQGARALWKNIRRTIARTGRQT